MSYDRHHYESFLPGALGLSVECDGHTQLLFDRKPVACFSYVLRLKLNHVTFASLFHQ